MNSDNEMKLNPYRWPLHILVILYYTMGFMVRFAWPPLIPLVTADLGISMAKAGAYMSAFYIGYVLIHIPGGLLGDRFGSRLVIDTALLVEGLGTLGLGLVSDFNLGFACRVLTGLGAGAIYSACVRYVSTLFPPKEAGLAFGLMMMAPAGVGIILPNLLMPWLSTVLSWRQSFIVLSGIVFLMSVVTFIVVRDKPALAQRRMSFGESFMAVIKNRNLVFLALASFWLMWVMVGFVSWGNTYVKELGFSVSTASLVMMAYGLTGIAASPLGGYLGQKISNPMAMFIILLLCLAPCVWGFGQSRSLWTLAAFSGAVGFIIGLANPLLPLLTAMFAGPELRATAGGVTGCIFQTGAILGPLAVGLSKDYTGGFALAWQLLTAAALVGAACLIPMVRKGARAAAQSA